MKKVIVILLSLLLLCSCNEEDIPEINYPYQINYEECDMSGYEGITSTGHIFRKIHCQELFNCIDQKSSGVFLYGTNYCGCCQLILRYLNQAAQDLNVNIYYIDIYEEFVKDEDGYCLNEDLMRLYMSDILSTVDGKKEIETPTLVSIINGEIFDNQICVNNTNWVDSSDENVYTKNVEKLLARYKEVLRPFAE